MEMKINIINLQSAKNNLNSLKDEINSNKIGSNFGGLITQESSGGVCDETNEIYGLLNTIKADIANLIDTTQICVNNGKVVAAKTDSDLSEIYQDTYSEYINQK